MTDESSKKYCAVPYYEDIGLLCYQADRISDDGVCSWEYLEEESRVWDREHPDEDRLFFDFVRETANDYCSLFYEILMALSKCPRDEDTCGLRRWMESPEAIEAAVTMRQLCRRAHVGGKSGVAGKARNPSRDEGPLVARHWYSTVNNAVSHTRVQERARVLVRPLPGNIALSNASFLGIPIYSAAPSAGLRIISVLTSRKSELIRMINGIGLPVRNKFYGLTMDEVPVSVSPAVSLPLPLLGELVLSSSRLSASVCYRHIRDMLALCLKSIIEIRDTGRGDLRQQIAEILRIATRSMISTDGEVRQCQLCRPKR
jgi:hypothetical protein